MNNKYDVIIIGAGPAGLECAKQLNNTNLSVLIIEKNETIGIKICAGGLTGLANNFDIPEDKTRSFIKQKFFIKEKQYEIASVNPIRTITRLDLGQHQLQQIKNSKNITVLTNTLINKIDNGRVNTDGNKNYYFKFLIGADGSSSIARKYLGLKSKYCIGLYYDIPKITDNLIWYLNPEEFKSGYIWVFPHHKYTSIGIYFNPELLNYKKAKETLERYLTDRKYFFSTKEIKSSFVNYNYQGCEFDNIFLVGDAAGLASKGTGEGISFALTSGKEIAKKILYPNYKTIELNKIIKVKQRQERMFKKFETFPVLQNFFLKIFVNLMKTKRFQVYWGNKE